MRRKKEWEIKNIVRQEIQAENLRIAAAEHGEEDEEEKDEFEELRRAANALAWFIERISADSGREKKKFSDAAYATMPEAAKVLKEIIETIDLLKGGG